MESIRNQHEYESLSQSSGGNKIRVLELLPGSGNDPIRGCLHSIYLDASAAYDAISYMWGDPEVTTEIEIDHDKHFRVTENAVSALRDLRQADKAMRLWRCHLYQPAGY